MSTVKPTPSAIGLVAQDLSRTLSFYRRLGVDIPPEADTADHVEVELAPGFRLMFDRVATMESFSEWIAPSGSPRASLAFDCGRPQRVDELYAAMTGAGYTGDLDPWDAVWGQRYARLADPDGTGVDLFASLT